MSARRYDSFHMGRSSIDLYSNDVGVPFEEIRSFAAYVGGSPTNISVGARRLGLRIGIVTSGPTEWVARHLDRIGDVRAGRLHDQDRLGDGLEVGAEVHG